MKAFIFSLCLLFVGMNLSQAQTASEMAAQLTTDYETKYGITLTDYQRKSIQSNYFTAISKMERIQHLQATNSMLYEQQRQKIVADAELRNSRLLTGAQMRQINAGKASSVVWPGKEKTIDESLTEDGSGDGATEDDFEDDTEGQGEGKTEGEGEGTGEGEGEGEGEWEDDDWGEDDFDSEGDGEGEGEGDILDKAVNKMLKVDNTAAADSTKGKKVLKKGLKFLYDELLRPALDKKVDAEPKKKEKNN